MEQNLANWHREICRVAGAVVYALYHRRASRENLRWWASVLRRIAQQMEDKANV